MHLAARAAIACSVNTRALTNFHDNELNCFGTATLRLPAQFRKLGYEMVDRMCDYYTNIDQAKVQPKSLQPGFLKGKLPAAPPEQAESFAAVMKDVESTIMPGA